MRCIRFALCLWAGTACAQTWQSLGPGPSFNGQVENITNREVVGAINALVPHPSNPDILYVGAVNGGIWRSINANASSPNWTRLGDAELSLSISALEMDVTDSSAQTLIAGIGNTSSLGRRGGELIGVLRTVNGGTSWTTLSTGITGQNVTGVAARGATLLVAGTTGLFRSTDTGAAFTKVSVGTGSGTGLPDGNFSDLAADPSNPARFYTPVITTSAGGVRGLYATSDTGQSWTLVSNAAMGTLFTASPQRVEVSVGATGVVYVAIVVSSRLGAIFRSADQGANWTDLGVPTTVEGTATQGVHPGAQGSIHLSLAVDPSNPDIFYIGGDRQPLLNEGGSGGTSFPNSLGANDFSGRLFRGNASEPLATRYTSLTHSGTDNNSSPHADSRDMAFAANGTLLESDDGGVYRRTNPASSSGRWLSINGDLQSTEYHSLAYDTVSNRVIGGAQDTGTTEQTSNSNTVFNSVLTADGGDVAVDDVSSTSQSFRFSSFQNLGSFRRRTCDAAGSCTGTVSVPLTVTDGSPAVSPQFYTPLEVNRVTGTRLLIGANNGIYESADRGATVVRLSTDRINSVVGSPIVYGIANNADYLLVGVNATLRRRTTAGGALSTVNSIAETVVDVAVNGDGAEMFVLGASSIARSTDSGANFSSILGNLATLGAGTLRAMAYVPNANGALVVGANRGVFVARASSGFTVWSRLATGMPRALVLELQYDPLDSILAAGTLGRGAWKLDMAAALSEDLLFRNGFEGVAR